MYVNILIYWWWVKAAADIIWLKNNDSDGTWTHNLRIRSPTRYPLRHRAVVHISKCMQTNPSLKGVEQYTINSNRWCKHIVHLNTVQNRNNSTFEFKSMVPNWLYVHFKIFNQFYYEIYCKQKANKLKTELTIISCKVGHNYL